MRDSRLIICAVLSIGGHLALAKGLGRLPKHADNAKRIISLRVVSAPPPTPEPPPEPATTPQPPAPKPAVAHIRTHVRTPPTAQEIPRQETPPPERPSAPNDGAAGPIFGVSMESTSQAGNGPAMKVGHTGGGAVAGPGDDDDARGGHKGAMAVVPAYEVTTMPLPQGRCEGQYTEEAKRAAIEGTVILDVIISETGRVRDVKVVSGLGHGLTEAAIAAVKGCRYSPGEKDGKAVPVKISGYKIRFLLPTDD
jgi:periplasmic protein TonB